MATSRMSGWQSLPAVALLCVTATAQNVRGWGRAAFDQEAFEVSVAAISANSRDAEFLVLTSDGRILVNSLVEASVPLPPMPFPGNPFVALDAGGSMAQLANGELLKWTPFSNQFVMLSQPPLPAGTSWTAFSGSRTSILSLRSDGVIQSWDPNTPSFFAVPVLAAGLQYESVSANEGLCSALVSDGTIRVWGYPVVVIQAPIPALPPGVTYTKVDSGFFFLVALRSDGQVVAFGDNFFGQLNVPPLPAGVIYVDVDAGAGHSIARRSDGQWVAWGDNYYGQCNIPVLAPGTLFTDLQAGNCFTVGLRSDARAVCWGCLEGEPLASPAPIYDDLDARGFGASTVRSDGSIMVLSSSSWAAPVLPPGVSYVHVRNSGDFMLGLASDGMLRAWGNNQHGQLNVPALPAGVSYVTMDAALFHAVALRSDGMVVGWGDNTWGQSIIPALPPGVQYVEAVTSGHVTLLRRSDDVVMGVGISSLNITTIPSIPSGLRFTQLGCGRTLATGLLSDGSVISWGSSAMPPPLPADRCYVEVSCGDTFALARRSDGQVVSWGQLARSTPPVLPRTSSFLRIASNYEWNVALVGSRSIYVRIGTGCSASLPVARLVPRDTPQIGRRLPVLLRDLPMDVAVMVMGWNQLLPGISLQSFGMVGCELHVSPDALFAVTGSNGEAAFELAIPYNPQLLGIEFYHQAVVLDPSPLSPSGLVMSEAMRGIVGG